jgi:transcriptional regulator GlxA family with amidase domain
VTHCHWVNSSQLLCEPNRLPLPEAPVPPNGADAAGELRAHVIRYIRAHLADPQLSRSSIAAAHHMSARTLDRLFAAQPWSVSGLIRHERLESVRRDLTDPALANHTVAALAARWCFFDAAHFSRLFRRHYGSPPSQARATG